MTDIYTFPLLWGFYLFVALFVGLCKLKYCASCFFYFYISAVEDMWVFFIHHLRNNYSGNYPVCFKALTGCPCTFKADLCLFSPSKEPFVLRLFVSVHGSENIPADQWKHAAGPSLLGKAQTGQHFKNPPKKYRTFNESIGIEAIFCKTEGFFFIVFTPLSSAFLRNGAKQP